MVTLRRVNASEDAHGDVTEAPVDRRWGPCAVAPRFATEQTDPHAPSVIVGLTVYGPATAIGSDDRLIIRGLTYEVDGLPGEWQSPFTGWAPGIEVPVKRAG